MRPFETPDDYYGMIDYFRNGSDEFLLGMGVDRARLPARDLWFEHAWRDHRLPENDPGRDRFFLGWLCDGATVGHSSP